MFAVYILVSLSVIIGIFLHERLSKIETEIQNIKNK